MAFGLHEVCLWCRRSKFLFASFTGNRQLLREDMLRTFGISIMAAICSIVKQSAKCIVCQFMWK